jgi:hypothetical protein
MHGMESGDSCGKSEEMETPQAFRGGSLSPAESLHSEYSAYLTPHLLVKSPKNNGRNYLLCETRMFFFFVYVSSF